MHTFKLLVVEDNEQDIQTCKDSLIVYNTQNQCNIELFECNTLEEAYNMLNSSFDGAIIDLKLGNEGNEGNRIIEKVVNSYFRIPIAILTGTPDGVDISHPYIGVYKKGEIEYKSLFEQFYKIYKTGLTRIMGGRGIIENVLNNVFLRNLLPQKDKWIVYGENNSEKSERALLRHTVNHLLQLLDSDEDKFYPEEVYIYPPFDDKLKTGCIVRRKKDNERFIVLNPACDLVIRSNGKFKTDRILLVEIDKNSMIQQIHGIQHKKNKNDLEKIESCKYHNADSESYKYILKYQTQTSKQQISELLRNSHNLFSHWLPETGFFEGGFINFRKISSFTVDEYNAQFGTPEIQISPLFVKDIVSRFSSYYARQGQPDIENNEIISKFEL